MTRRPGFALIEILLALSFFGAFSLVAYRLMYASVHLTAQTLRADDNSARFDSAVQMLRADVSASSSIQMPQKSLLRIHGPGSQVIDWTTADNSLRRSAGSEQCAWSLGRPVTLQQDGAIVLISANPSDQIALASLHSGGRQ